MRLGVVARADQRGLGVLTSEVVAHMEPERVLVIREPSAEARGFAPDLTQYPDATVLTWDGALDESACRRWLDGLDCVWMAETPYDLRFPVWAREAQVRSVLMVMPEFYRWGDENLPRPDVFWTPTTWRLATLDPATRVVPVPVAVERFTPQVRTEPTFLHLVGHRAARDRAGTTRLTMALRFVRSSFRLIIATQDRMLPAPRPARGVQIEMRKGGVERYWESYAEGSVLLSPRRYGGLSLPHNEAAAAGLGLVLTDCPPNHHWPGVYVAARSRSTIPTAAGMVPMFDVEPRALASAIDGLVASGIEEASRASLAWAAAHSWEALGPFWRDELDRACQ